MQPIRSAAAGRGGAFAPAPNVFDDQGFSLHDWREIPLACVIADVHSEKRIHSRFFISYTCTFSRLLSRVHSFGS